MYGFQDQAVGNKKTVIGGQKNNNPYYAVEKTFGKIVACDNLQDRQIYIA